MPSVNIKLTERMMELVNNNVVTLHVDVFGTGIDVYGRVTQPHPGLGVFPHTSYTLGDLESSLEKIRIKQDFSVKLDPDKATAAIEKSAATLNVCDEQPVVRYGTFGRLGIKIPKQIYTGATWNLLPEDSLTFKEFDILSAEELKARALAVAERKGASRTWGFAVAQQGATGSLTSHWASSNGEERFAMLSNQKKAGTTTKGGKRHAYDFLQGLNCPFRGKDHLSSPEGSGSEAHGFNENLEGVELCFET
jgi:hypothetical protein